MIGAQIRKYREKSGMSQVQLAKALNYNHQSVVSMWERNERNPNLEILVPLADVLHCTLDQLLREG